MGVQSDRLADIRAATDAPGESPADGNGTDATAGDGPDTDADAADVPNPFSMAYDLDDFSADADVVEQLGTIAAVAARIL